MLEVTWWNGSRSGERVAKKMAEKGSEPWYSSGRRKIDGALLDICGVLYESGGAGAAIQGSVQAVKRLKDAGVPVRFCTNWTTSTKQQIANTLRGCGFEIEASEIFTPTPAVVQLLREEGLRPHLLVHEKVVGDFAECDTSNPNCVVIGDAGDNFSYQNINKAFQTLISSERPRLISMGKSKYCKQTEGFMLDVGPFATALEFAADVKAELVGKPSKRFFMAPLNNMGIKPENAFMVGDDIISDVGGAQECGMLGIQVRTGKFRAVRDEHHPLVTPDGYVDNLAQAVELFLQHRKL